MQHLFESLGLAVEAYGPGEEFLERLAANRERLPIIIITGRGDIQLAVRAMKVGAVGFIEEPLTDDVIPDGVRQTLGLDKQGRAKQSEIDKSAENAFSSAERMATWAIWASRSHSSSASPMARSISWVSALSAWPRSSVIRPSRPRASIPISEATAFIVQ